MTHSSNDPEFSYKGMPVGYFKNEFVPSMPGRYQYEPYRGSGHYEMQTALQSGERPCCTIGETTFEVLDCPEYGILVLSGFVDGEPDAPQLAQE